MLRRFSAVFIYLLADLEVLLIYKGEPLILECDISNCRIKKFYKLRLDLRSKILLQGENFKPKFKIVHSILEFKKFEMRCGK
ncbi:hypothetical protein BpHYR1_009672 [Brachionus plicatilis]|uniref:Uncharacterized protein n=1 Tax=Brachionus plicatilis TaxID=10195 RepID=A0A3M7SJZ1_BRAPC|nr:hypothetical protein BpHYR1_009672 [Brachionus plicatilis]